MQGLQYHGAQTVEAVLAVAMLIAELLAGEDEDAGGGQAGTLLFDKTVSDVARKGGRIQQWPVKSDLAVDLVDVLAAGAGTANEFDLEFAGGNANEWSDFEVVTIGGCHGKVLWGKS